MNIDILIKEHSLYIDKEDEEFINKFSSTTGTKFPKGKLGNYLGSWFEGYIYTLLIGIITGERRYEGFKDKQQKMRSWNSATLEQYKYCISLVLSKPDIVGEIGLNKREEVDKYLELTNENESATFTILNKIKDICDQFSLGGVDFIKRYEEQDPEIFDDPFALKTIFDSALENKIE